MPDEVAQYQIVNPKRDAIVVAARVLFLEHGFGDVSMDAIAAKAKVSKRTVYNHFENKAQLFESIMGDACHGQHFEDDTGVPVDPPEQVLTRMGLTFLGIISRDEGVALYRVVMAEGSKFPDLAKAFSNHTEILSRKLGDYLEEQTAKGVLRVENSRQAAHQFMAMLFEPIMMQLTIGVRGPASEKEIGEIVDASVSTFLRAFMV